MSSFARYQNGRNSDMNLSKMHKEQEANFQYGGPLSRSSTRINLRTSQAPAMNGSMHRSITSQQTYHSSNRINVHVSKKILEKLTISDPKDPYQQKRIPEKFFGRSSATTKRGSPLSMKMAAH